MGLKVRISLKRFFSFRLFRNVNSLNLAKGSRDINGQSEVFIQPFSALVAQTIGSFQMSRPQFVKELKAILAGRIKVEMPEIG